MYKRLNSGFEKHVSALSLSLYILNRANKILRANNTKRTMKMNEPKKRKKNKVNTKLERQKKNTQNMKMKSKKKKC